MQTTTANNVRTVLSFGTPVRLSFLDLYGFNGRDLHPSVNDVGFLGRVVRADVDVVDDDLYALDRIEHAVGGTVVHGDMSYVCYLVRAPDGRELQLIDHEIEVMTP